MIYITLAILRDFLRPRHDLILENLALRQQILVLQRTNPRPPFRDRDRAFWVIVDPRVLVQAAQTLLTERRPGAVAGQAFEAVAVPLSD